MDIEVSGIYKSYDNKQVLKDFSILLPEGQITCIMGPSGCGKTTLLHILIGVLKADSGTIIGMPAKKGVVFQEDRLCEEFSALENVRLVLGKQFDKKCAEEAIVALGLSREEARIPIRELSGGMKRRIAVVRAILADNEILFFDEPFKGLDEQTKDIVLRYVIEKRKGRTLVMITHDLMEAEAMGGQIIKMY